MSRTPPQLRRLRRVIRLYARPDDLSQGLDSELGEGPALELGPGSTWGRVLQRIPTSSYTMMHGQCLTVGVGGYLLGGGVNVVGTSQRIGSGSSNVLQYTMVDSDGFIVKVGNSTILFINQ